MQYLILAYDGDEPEALQRRLTVRSEHIALGDRLRDAGNLLYAVAMLNDAGEMCGSVMVVDFPTRDDLDRWLQVEPYIISQVWASVQITECKVAPSFIAQ